MANEELLNVPLKCTRFWTTGMYRMSGKYKSVKKGPDKQILKYSRKIRPAIYPTIIISSDKVEKHNPKKQGLPKKIHK